MKKYARIQKFDEDGDLTVDYIEPLTVEDISVAIETELVDEAEQGEKMVITIVEMDEEEYKALAQAEGY